MLSWRQGRWWRWLSRSRTTWAGPCIPPRTSVLRCGGALPHAHPYTAQWLARRRMGMRVLPRVADLHLPNSGKHTKRKSRRCRSSPFDDALCGLDDGWADEDEDEDGEGDGDGDGSKGESPHPTNTCQSPPFILRSNLRLLWRLAGHAGHAQSPALHQLTQSCVLVHRWHVELSLGTRDFIAQNCSRWCSL